MDPVPIQEWQNGVQRNGHCPNFKPPSSISLYAIQAYVFLVTSVCTVCATLQFLSRLLCQPFGMTVLDRAYLTPSLPLFATV